MKPSLEQDKKRRKLFSDSEIRRKYYQFMLLNNALKSESRLFYQQKLSLLPRNTSMTRIKNRCLLTGRGRGIFSFYGLSRISFRELASKGSLPGIKKKSW